MDRINYEVALDTLLKQTNGRLPKLDSWVWVNLSTGSTTSALGIQVAELLALALVDISDSQPAPAPVASAEATPLPADSKPVVLAELAGQMTALMN